MTAGGWLAVAAAGGVGAIARLLVDGTVSAGFDGGFPAGTLAVNLSGAFVLGLLTGLGAGGDALVVDGTALIGSFTTFSTWMYETQRLAEDRDGRRALLNVAVSLAAGFVVAAAGRVLGTAL